MSSRSALVSLFVLAAGSACGSGSASDAGGSALGGGAATPGGGSAGASGAGQLPLVGGAGGAAGGGQGQVPQPTAGSAGASGAAGSEGTAGAGGTAAYEPVLAAEYDEMPLYSGTPPNLRSNAPNETLNDAGHIGNVSVPTLRRFPMDASKATGLGYLVFPGGGYFILDMDSHAAKLAERVGPQGIAVFALKYRVGDGSNDAPRDALLDAKRAVRLVRENAARWGVKVDQLGVIGYSAGSHLALNLADNFDEGSPGDADLVERHSSRPSFVGSMSTWSFGAPVSPFTFPANVPPAFFCHAENDDGAPIALARAVESQISGLGASTLLDVYLSGGHSTCHVGDPAMAGRNWPDKFLPWVQAALK